MARTQRELWQDAGAKRLSEVAEETVEAILSGPPPECLSDTQRRDLLAIEERAMSRLG